MSNLKIAFDHGATDDAVLTNATEGTQEIANKLSASNPDGFFNAGGGTNAVIGKGTTPPVAAGANAFAHGDQASAAGDHSFAQGYDADVGADNSFAQGKDITIPSGFHNFAQGSNITLAASLQKVFAQGDSHTSILSSTCFVQGTLNSIAVSSGYSLNQGSGNAISSSDCLAQGRTNAIGASSANSFAQGRSHTVDGADSFAQGYNHDVNASKSFCQGNTNYIGTGSNIFAQGNSHSVGGASAVTNCFVQGDNHTIGVYADNTFVQGRDITTSGSGDNSFAQGRNITVTGNRVFVQGAYASGIREDQKAWGSNRTTAVGSAQFSHMTKHVQTTNDTVTTIIDLSLEQDKAYAIWCHVIARNTTTDDEVASFFLNQATAYRDTAGAAVLVGTPTFTKEATTGGPAGGAFTVTIVSSTNSIFIRVTGEPAAQVQTYEWCATLKFTEVLG